MSGRIPFFRLVTGFAPYPWQVRLFSELRSGHIREALTLPTGSGKTSAALIYLLALIDGADLPSRLVYIVDRRAIVDQTAEEIERWASQLSEIAEIARRIASRAAFPVDDALIPIGVLRGGTVDSGQWRIDPARPSVIVGTVDMIGSRLLFAGYGDGRARRSLHAGLLGYDATVILDEAHLSSRMAALLHSIRDVQAECWRPKFAFVTMSATPENPSSVTHNDEDLEHIEFRKRLTASKHCELHLAKSNTDRRRQMVDLATQYETQSVLCYVRTVEDATLLHRDLTKQIGDGTRVGLLTGTLRGRERAELSKGVAWRRFLPSRERDIEQSSMFLVSTAAGEVGVDIDADHVVMDLAPIDSVIQRLGRVNRGGHVSRSDVHVVYTEADLQHPDRLKTWRHRLGRAHGLTRTLLSGLSDVSPKTVMSIDPDARRDASTPGPRIARIDRSRIDLLAATSVSERDHAIGKFLRGHTDDPEPPDAQVVWRHDVFALAQTDDHVVESVLGIFPPSPEEVLKAPATFVLNVVGKLIDRNDGLVAILRDQAGAVSICRPNTPDDLPDIRFGTLFLPTSVGGLSQDGLLTASAKDEVEDLADNDERIRFEETSTGRTTDPPEWVDRAIRLRVPLHAAEAEDDEQRWLVYARRKIGEMTLGSDTDELTRLAARYQTLSEHNTAVGEAAEAVAKSVGLPTEMVEVLRVAGAWHDKGKARSVWQRAAGNRGEPMAKSTSGTLRPALLGGYRHEFGSLVDAERALKSGADTESQRLRDLTLHLVAAHHGHARPGFPNPRQWDPDLADSVSAEMAEQVERRFAALQARFGPWGLAWLESLLKAADAWVSTGNTISAD